uniref:LamG-like jellyroll fold domain-containing protein n=1 Tax=viral metagenome TaxID=1070528 RepID=A0A6C0IVY0_9ZZZZ
MNYKYLVIFAIILLLLGLYFSYKKYTNTYYSLLLDQPKNSKINYSVEKNLLKKNVKNTGITWTLNFWIYIKDWTYNFNKNKYIIVWDNCNIWLDKNSNDLHIHIPTYNSNQGTKLKILNLPLQKWLNISVILDNRNLDVWVNSKLYNSKYINNIPKFINQSNMKINPYGGYNGYVSQVKYYNYVIKKNQLLGINNLYRIFKNGPFGFQIPIISNFNFLYKKIPKINMKIEIDK